jgi:hypothetical protein
VPAHAPAHAPAPGAENGSGSEDGYGVSVLALLVLAGAPDAGLPLPEILRRLGDEAERREAAPPCTYHEVTLVEDITEDGGVKGSEERVYDGEIHGIEVVKRERLSVTPKGAPLADLLAEPKNAKGRKPARSPFHSAVRSQYRFELADGPTPELKRVRLEPLKPDVERVRGEALVRTADGRIEEMTVSPSNVPLLLESVTLRFVFGDTACGHVAVEIDTEGKGQSLITDTRFRTKTVLSGHKRTR